MDAVFVSINIRLNQLKNKGEVLCQTEKHKPL